MAAKRRLPGSISLGFTSRGSLINAARLALKGPHHAVLPHARGRKTNFGTDQLVTLIKYAAAAVAKRHPGAHLMLGNLSFQRGGPIPWSRSHKAGRDVDLAFFMHRAGRRRKNAQPARLMSFDPRLRSRSPRGYRFDVARNWSLVAALVSHPTIRVQWLFIASHLRKALLAHGRKQGASALILGRADRVLKQPTDSRSHDDHLHLRLFCTARDRLEGCRDRAPFWPGCADGAQAVARRIKRLLPGLQDPDAATRARVVSFLVRLDARQTLAKLARLGLRDPSGAMRLRILKLIRRWAGRSPAVTDAVINLIQRPGGGLKRGDPRFERRGKGHFDDPKRSSEQLIKAYALLPTLSSSKVVRLLRRALLSQRVLRLARRSLPEAALAAQAAGRVSSLRLVSPLISALGHEHAAVREPAAVALRRLTNRSFGYRWRGRLSKGRRQYRQKRWRRWWKRHQTRNRRALVSLGFRRVYRVMRRPSSRRAQRLLVSLTSRNDYLSDNAHFLLCGQHPAACPRKLREASARNRAWNRWWRAREARRLRRQRRLRSKRRRRRRRRPRSRRRQPPRASLSRRIRIKTRRRQRRRGRRHIALSRTR